MNNRKLVRLLEGMIEAEGNKLVGVTKNKHLRLEIEHAGRRYMVSAACTPKDANACVNSVRQMMWRVIKDNKEKTHEQFC